MNLKVRKIIAREFLFLILIGLIVLVEFLGLECYNYFQKIKINSLKSQIDLKEKMSDSLTHSFSHKFQSQLNFANEYYNRYYYKLSLTPVNFTPLPDGVTPINENGWRPPAKDKIVDPIPPPPKDALPILPPPPPKGLLIQNKLLPLEKYYNENGLPFSYRDNLKVFERLEYLMKNDSLKIIWNERKDFPVFNKKLGIASYQQLENFITSNKITDRDIEDNKQSKIVENEMDLLGKEKSDSQLKLLSNDNEQNILFITTYLLIAILFFLRYVVYATKWSIKTLRT